MMEWVGVVPILVVLMAGVGFAQAWFLSRKLNTKIAELEHQLNSNMERQIEQAVGEAVAKEQLRAQMEKR